MYKFYIKWGKFFTRTKNFPIWSCLWSKMVSSPSDNQFTRTSILDLKIEVLNLGQVPKKDLTKGQENLSKIDSIFDSILSKIIDFCKKQSKIDTVFERFSKNRPFLGRFLTRTRVPPPQVINLGPRPDLGPFQDPNQA